MNQTTDIDYVLVLDTKIKRTKAKHLPYVGQLIRHLQSIGIKLKIQAGNVKEHIYITLHLPPETAKRFAQIYNIEIDNSGHNYIPNKSIINCKFLDTPFSNYVFARQEKKITSTERILIMSEILDEAKFGPCETDYGIEKLQNLGLIKTAYPLHDLHADPNINDGLSDRQLLVKYWANLNVWYKTQPLNLIEKYYGPEVAFYFAWLGFYNKMLIPATVVGLVCFISSVIQLVVVNHERADEICKSDLVICPLCHSGTNCFYRSLNQSCAYATASVAFDNYATVFFAIFMSFWATAFIKLWERTENILKVRWNVEFIEADTKIRLKYKEASKNLRLSAISGALEPYTAPRKRAIYLFLSYGTCLLLIGIVILAIFGVIMYRIFVATLIRIGPSKWAKTHATFILICTSSILQVIFIQFFGRFYGCLSQWLTMIENPRTQSEFDSSLVHKRYFLAFANNYASLFYTAFLKGHFFTPEHKPTMVSIELDICHPIGCVVALCVQLAFLMIFKSMIGHILTLVLPKIKTFFKKTTLHKRTNDSPQYEEEFKLNPTGKYFLTKDFNEMVIQYGFVTFFVAVFPLAPLCALINNCIELRLDAFKLTTTHRRPIPKKQSGIGPWKNILQAVTHLSVATNAFVLGFTSDFVCREIYKYAHNWSLKGYIKSTLSLYDMRDFHGAHVRSPSWNNSTLCYYKAYKYPPKHEKKYELTPVYWYQFGMRLLCVIIFEHVIWITNGILSYLISAVPYIVKQKLWFDRNLERDLEFRVKYIENQNLNRRTSIKIQTQLDDAQDTIKAKQNSSTVV